MAHRSDARKPFRALVSERELPPRWRGSCRAGARTRSALAAKAAAQRGVAPPRRARTCMPAEARRLAPPRGWQQHAHRAPGGI
jgi:hypothetical protein